MKATSHFAIAHLLYAALQKRGVYLNRVAFVYGNISPDQTPAMWFAPHFGKVCSRRTAEALSILAQQPLSSSGRVGPEYSKSLGELCHYLCDYFCFAHNTDFSGNLRQHMAYENALDACLRRDCLALLKSDAASPPAFCGVSAEQLAARNEMHKRAYLNEGRSPENDLRHAFEACMASVIGVTALSKHLPSPSIGRDVDDFVSALKGYATGNHLIFRVFFFKYRNSDLFFLPELIPPIGA